MKKLLSVLFATLVMAGNAIAAEITDIPENYWAATEISYCVKNGIIKQYGDGSFKPEVEVKRAEFNSMLLRTLGYLPTEVPDKNIFKDLNNNHWSYSDILKSEQMGLLYGYPDKTFKPEVKITKTETASIISHITKQVAENVGILSQFADGKDVPAWGKNQYAKSIELGIYVNYPDAAYLLPNKTLNRAEAAVLLYRLRKAMGEIQEKYVAKEVTVGTEHLDNGDYSDGDASGDFANNKVMVTNFRRIVLAGNVIRASFVGNFDANSIDFESPLNFTFVNDVYTEEGSLIIPRGSMLKAIVSAMEPQKVISPDTKISVVFSEITFPSGKKAALHGKILDKKGDLTIARLATFGNIAGYTLGGAAIGAGSGVGIAAAPDMAKRKKAALDGLKSASGAGRLTGLVTPGLPIKADVDDSLFIELTRDFSFYEAESL